MIGVIEGFGSSHYDFINDDGKRVVGDTWLVSVNLGDYLNDDKHKGVGNHIESYKCSEKFCGSIQQGDKVYIEVDNTRRIRSAMLEVTDNAYMPIEV